MLTNGKNQPRAEAPGFEDAASGFRENEELLGLAQEAGRVGIFEWQVQTGAMRLSAKFLSLYGLTDFDGRYESWIKCIFREDVPRVVHLLEKAFAAKERETQKVAARACELWDGAELAGEGDSAVGEGPGEADAAVEELGKSSLGAGVGVGVAEAQAASTNAIARLPILVPLPANDMTPRTMRASGGGCCQPLYIGGVRAFVRPGHRCA
jgi:hypothetical protein